MASFVTQPHVVDFVDVVMHDGSLEFRLGELAVPTPSALVGNSLRSAQLRERTGALELSIRRPDGGFITNPSPSHVVEAGDVLIGIGAADQLGALTRLFDHA
ncbi:MAG: cation:proton antiporter regulatory subunit [Acidimicrobiales bacterium]